MKHPNAILLFARVPDLRRSAGNGPFDALPWEDLDGVFHSCAADLLQSAAAVPDTDVLLHVAPRFPEERLAVPAGNGVRRVPWPAGEQQGEAVQLAAEGAFLEYYHRVTVVLENNPLLGPGILRAAADQLGVEDDCAVFTPGDGSDVVLVALKANAPSLFHGGGADHLAREGGVMARLCELDLAVFPTAPSFRLAATADLARLMEGVSLLDPAAPGYPKRTAAAFRALEKKYRWRKPVA